MSNFTSSAPSAGVKSWLRFARGLPEDEARYKAFAETVQSPNKKYVHRRESAAAMVSAAIGAPYSGALLRRSDCRYAAKGRIAFYAEDDLRALAESILDKASERKGTPDRRRRRIAA
jgi:hypothetical protein